MKRIASVGAVVVALGLLSVLGVAQVVLDTRLSPASSIPWPRDSLSNAFLISSRACTAQAPAFAAAYKPEFKGQTISSSNHICLPSPPPRIPAGAYKTAPYSCIVVVPGPHPDDQCIVGPVGADASMPIIKPELRFIPLRPAKK